jgi:glycerol-3-phosphate dehydrogenase
VLTAERATALLRLFLHNRWLGIAPILHGAQLKQAALNNWMVRGTLNVEALPASEEVVL